MASNIIAYTGSLVAGGAGCEPSRLLFYCRIYSQS